MGTVCPTRLRLWGGTIQVSRSNALVRAIQKVAELVERQMRTESWLTASARAHVVPMISNGAAPRPRRLARPLDRSGQNQEEACHRYHRHRFS